MPDVLSRVATFCAHCDATRPHACLPGGILRCETCGETGYPRRRESDRRPRAELPRETWARRAAACGTVAVARSAVADRRLRVERIAIGIAVGIAAVALGAACWWAASAWVGPF